MSCVGGTMDTKGLTGVLGDKWGDSMNKEEAKKEALALVVQERIERLNKLRERSRSFDEKKKQINDVICIIKDICDGHFSECMSCPLYKHICNGLGGWQVQPYLWKMLD